MNTMTFDQTAPKAKTAAGDDKAMLRAAATLTRMGFTLFTERDLNDEDSGLS